MERATYALSGIPKVTGVLRYTHRVKVTAGRVPADPAAAALPVAARRARRSSAPRVRALHPRPAGRRSPDPGAGHRVGGGLPDALGHLATAGQGQAPRRRAPPGHLQRRHPRPDHHQRQEVRRAWPSRPTTTRAAGEPRACSFRRVAKGGSFTLVLAEASTVPSFSSQCSATYSCRVGRYVIINQTRWQHRLPGRGTQGGRSLRDYRHLVVNHETGHWLGKGHADCPGAGRAGAGDGAAVEGDRRVPLQPVADACRAALSAPPSPSVTARAVSSRAAGASCQSCRARPRAPSRSSARLATSPLRTGCLVAA